MVTSGVKDTLERDPRNIDDFAKDHVEAFKAVIDGGAWGAGLATFSGDRVLEVFYPDAAARRRRRAGPRAERRGRRAARPAGRQRTDDRATCARRRS